MRKIFVIALILFFSCLNLKAQDTSGNLKKPKGKTFISIELGRTYFRDEVSDPGGKFVSNRFDTPTFGVFIERELNQKLSIESGIAIRNFRTSLRSNCDVITRKNTVFQIPIRLNYAIWDQGKFRLNAFAGVIASFQSTGDSGFLSGSEFSYNFLTDGPEVSFAPEIGLKLDYNINSRLKVGLFTSYVLSPRELNRTNINYSIDGNAPIQAISRNQGSYFQAGFRVSYLLR